MALIPQTGGGSGIENLVEDTSPTLGGNLDLDGNLIVSPDGTDGIDIPDGTIDLQTASTSRVDITDAGVRLGAANARVTTILDEDTMSSDSATALSTQQSIKAYVDASAGGGSSTVEFSVATDDYYPIGMWTAGASNNNHSVTVNTLYGFRFYNLCATTTWTRIGTEVVVATGGAQDCRIGIYNDENGRPGQLVLDAGTFDISSTGVKELTISQELDPGIYWFAYISDASGWNIRGFPNCTPPGAVGMNGSFNISSGWVHRVTRSVTYGALPSPFGTATEVTGNGNFTEIGAFLRKV